MTKLLASLKTWTGTTSNGAVTHKSTLNACLDLFFIAGASRRMEEKEILRLFTLAFNEDKNTALKILFWARDIRWGAGERRFFRIIWKFLMQQHSEVVEQLAKYVSEYGRWDDLFVEDYFINNQVKPNVWNNIVEIISTTLSEGIVNGTEWNSSGLLAKWMPRKWLVASKFRNALMLSAKEYRQMIVSLSKTVEQDMSANRWENIEFSKVPSQALNKYKKAWHLHLEEEFNAFLEKVNKWEEKLNGATLFPYQVYQNYDQWVKDDLVKAQWDNLPDYWAEGDILPVVDVSGSMTSGYGSNLRPIDISISLGVYLAERIKGRFNNHFISFSWRPTLHTLNGNIIEKFLQVQDSGEDMSTNLVGVFDELLKVSLRDNLSQEDLPKMLLIISDMEFNYCWRLPNFETIKKKFEEAWYVLPHLVFWNVNGRSDNVPVQENEQFVSLVSGASPSLIKGLLSWKITTPYDTMMSIVNSDRYENIKLN